MKKPTYKELDASRDNWEVFSFISVVIAVAFIMGFILLAVNSNSIYKNLLSENEQLIRENNILKCQLNETCKIELIYSFKVNGILTKVDEHRCNLPIIAGMNYTKEDLVKYCEVVE